jgi:hypothetical protein
VAGFMLDRHELTNRAREYAAQFREATPFAHVVFDEFLPCKPPNCGICLTDANMQGSEASLDYNQLLRECNTPARASRPPRSKVG